MNREITYELKVDLPRQMTKEEAREMDRKQPWRQRVSAGAMEDINALRVLALWMQKITKSPKNQELMRQMGAYGNARRAEGFARAAAEKMLQNISAEQLRTLDANWPSTNITLSSAKMVKGFVNIDVDTAGVLIRETVKGCREKFCMKDERDSRTCPIRQALDNCINAGRFAAKYEGYMGLCPYCLKGLEGEE